MDTFISVEEARTAILADVPRLGAERVTIVEAAGRILREDVFAPFDSPAFDNSAMDGFAMRAVDASDALRVIGESAAGNPYRDTVGPGEAIRIMTGAAVPEGVDCVVMRENATLEDATLRVNPVPSPGVNIRRRGEYMRAGELVIAAGELVSGADVGLLSTFGRTVVYVTRAPRVTIVTTGTELAEPDRALEAGQIVNSNAYMLQALGREAGAFVTVAPIVPDDEEATRAVIEDAARSTDLLVTVGGVSVGDYDFVRSVLEELSGGMQFWKVRMKPGKPLAFGVIDGRVPAIGLPGNPVSSFVGFHQFVRPALNAQKGLAREESALRRVQLTAACDIHSTPARQQFVLGTVDGVQFRPHPDQSSGNPLAMRGCTAFGIVDEGVKLVKAGEVLAVELL